MFAFCFKWTLTQNLKQVDYKGQLCLNPRHAKSPKTVCMCHYSNSVLCSFCHSSCLFLLSRAPHLITRRASPPAGPGALVLERPPRWHERGLPWRKAALLCSHYWPGPLLPRQHFSCIHRSKPTGESDINLLLRGFLWKMHFWMCMFCTYYVCMCNWVWLDGIQFFCIAIDMYT